MGRYKDELLKRMANSPKKNLAAFLCIKDDIKDALDAKIPMLTIHADLVKIGKINVGYVQFRAYIKKHINGSISAKKSEPEPPKYKDKTKESDEINKLVDSYTEDQTNPFLKKL